MMKRAWSPYLTGSLLLLALPASAERPWTGYVPVPDEHVVSRDTAPLEAGAPLIIYMNRHGGVFTYGDDDSRSNHSRVLRYEQVNVPPYPYGDESWDQVMSCMRNMYGRWNVEVTDVDPGSVPHLESVVAGSPDTLGLPDYVGGIAPSGCGGIVENGVAWTFPEVWGNRPRDICETAAQETAHAFSLDHEFLCEDPMTYLWEDPDTGLSCGPKSFQNVNAPCGEDGPRTCRCGGSTQNSVALLTEILGLRTAQPPEVSITRPQSGDTVSPGFVIDVMANDDVDIARVEIYIDNQLLVNDTSFPFGAQAPADLSMGGHEIHVVAFDSDGLTAEHIVAIDLAPGCEESGECPDGEVCLGGSCVPGPGSPGGLGEPCSVDEDCVSNLCGTAGNGSFCTGLCDFGGGGCPAGFECLDAGGGQGVCWAGNAEGDGDGDDEEDGNATGFCAMGTPAAGGRRAIGGLVLALGAVGLLVLRRRRR